MSKIRSKSCQPGEFSIFVPKNAQILVILGFLDRANRGQPGTCRRLCINSKSQEESLNTTQLANIEEKHVTEDLNINTIRAKKISIQFEEHKYNFTGQDFIDTFESNKSEMKAGGYSKVFQISKKSSGSKPNITSSFIIKTFDNFLISESPGCNNSLEIKFLEDLSKKFPGISPYLKHVSLNLPHKNIKKYIIIMKCFDFDLDELIFFFMHIKDMSDFKDTHFQKNRLIQQKWAFYKEFYKSTTRTPNLIHESIIELTILKVMKTLYALNKTFTRGDNKESTIHFDTIAHGDIKPLNILIGSSRTRPIDLVSD